MSKLRGGTVHFYPSHLTRGLLASIVSLAFARIAIREFSLIGKDKYPPIPANIPTNQRLPS